MSPPSHASAAQDTTTDNQTLPFNSLLFRRTILSNLGSQEGHRRESRIAPPLTGSSVIAQISPTQTLRITVNLPRVNSMSSAPTNEPLVHSRQLPRSFPPSSALDRTRRLGGHQTPPVVASGTNRVPVLSRRTRLSNKVSTSTSAFSTPTYLSYSSSFRKLPIVHGDGTLTHAASPSLLGKGGLDVSVAEDDFTAPGNDPETSSSPAFGQDCRLPTCWAEQDKCNLMELSNDGLGVSFAGSAKHGDKDAAAVRANHPIPARAGIYYFEITIVDKGQSGYIGIGFSHRDVKLSRLPGWEDHSWGYHGDDGRAFCCLGTGESFGPTFTTGDIIGCGVDYTYHSEKTEEYQSSEKQRQGSRANFTKGSRAFFTKNGAFLGYAFAELTGKLYPSVGLRTPGEMVRANFGAQPFNFDIDSYVRFRKQRILEEIGRQTIPTSFHLPPPRPAIPCLFPTSDSERASETLQQVISSYLLHHGYALTAESFELQLKEERIERSNNLVPSIAVLSDSNTVEGISMEQEEPPEEKAAFESAILARAQIRRMFLQGDIETAINLTTEHFPLVLTGDQKGEDLMFKLQLRTFIEAVMMGSSEKAIKEDNTNARTIRDIKGKGRAKAIVTEEDVNMNMDDSPEQDSSQLDDLILMGKTLHARYSSDTRPHIQEALSLTFSLMAYGDPANTPGKIGQLVSTQAREKLADELNSAILVSQSLPPIPHLESMYRHTSAALRLLGDVDDGNAAIVEPQDMLQLPRKYGYDKWPDEWQDKLYPGNNNTISVHALPEHNKMHL